MEISLAEIAHVCGMGNLSRLRDLLPRMNAVLASAEINTPARAAMWLGQISHETADFSRFEENLNYSGEALLKTWPRHFETPEIAAAYAHQPERIGNRAYALRLGNGDEESGEGWRFRGRGAIQLTGFSLYHRLSAETGIDFVTNPEFVAQPEYAFLAAARFWIWHGVNHAADQADPGAAVLGATKAINGGIIGLADRDARYRRALELMQPQP